MYEAAVVLMTRVKRASGLKDWADAIAKRSGAGKARIALARKLAVIMHSIWRSGENAFELVRPADAELTKILRNSVLTRLGRDGCPAGRGCGLTA